MGIEIIQTGGFIPQTQIKITDSRANTLLSNIKIERKAGTDAFATILQTDTEGSTFQINDVNDFGKAYEYRVSYDVYQKQAYTNSSTNKRNYWLENWNLGALKVSSDGTLSGTGIATAKPEYLARLNQTGTAVINTTAWIGSGGDSRGFNGGHEVVKKGKKVSYKQLDKNTYDNIIVYCDYGNNNTPRSLFVTKAWSNSKAWSKRFWIYFNKRDVNNRRNQIRLYKDGADGFDLQLYFRRTSKAYDYGFPRGMAGFNSSNGLSTNGGRCSRLRIALKNGAKVRPDFNVTVTSGTMYRYVKLGSYNLTKRIIVKDEPDIDYGIFINEYGEGFRFNQYESNGLISSSGYETTSTTQMLELQDSKLPIPYVNDNRKTPTIDFKILVDNLAYRNRIRERVLNQNYVYLFIPKSWKYQIETGFYAYEKCVEERLDTNIYAFNFSGARVVLGNINVPPKWTYQRLADSERSFISTIDNYKDFRDLAISPLGNEIPGLEEV